MGLYFAVKTQDNLFDVYKHGTGELCGAIIFQERLPIAKLMSQYPVCDVNQWDCPLCSTRGALEYKTLTDEDKKRASQWRNFLRRIMMTALQGGIAQWAELRAITRGYDGDLDSFEARDQFDSTAAWVRVVPGVIESAIELACKGKTGLSKDQVDRLFELVRHHDGAAAPDAELANALVQLAVLGELTTPVAIASNVCV